MGNIRVGLFFSWNEGRGDCFCSMFLGGFVGVFWGGVCVFVWDFFWGGWGCFIEGKGVFLICNTLWLHV